MDLKVQIETGCALRQIRFALTAPGLGQRQRSIKSGSNDLGVCGPIALGQWRSRRRSLAGVGFGSAVFSQVEVRPIAR
jgi:hypothetical protein